MITGADLKARIGRVFRRIYVSRFVGKIEDWARKNIYLSSEESGDFPGPYDPEINPLPTILFWAYQSGKYRKAVFKKSSQSGVTLVVLIFVCWYAGFVVRNFLYVLDSVDEMRRVSKTRLKPMLKKCKGLEGRIPEDEDEMSNLTLNLHGCVGYLASSNSLAALSNKSTGLNVYDEVDGYAAIKSTGEKATELGKERGKAQSTFFEILLGKPIDWDGTINTEYLLGTQHKCFLPCPHCGTMPDLEWERIRFRHCRDAKGQWETGRLAAEIYYECRGKANEACIAAEGKILESHKAGMLKKRDWRQTNFGDKPDRPLSEGVFSAEITDLYSLRKGSSWADLAREWIEAQGDTSKMQNFLRGRLARPKKSQQIQVATSDIYRMTKPYERGHLPHDVDLVLMASDVQQVPPVKKWVKVGFRLSGDSCHVIDRGENRAFSDLQEEADKPVIVDQWGRWVPRDRRVNPNCRVGLIDERHEPDKVRDFVVSTLRGYDAHGQPVYRFYSVRGWGGMHTRKMKSIVTPLIGERANASHNGYPLWVYDLSDDDFKDRLYHQRINKFREVLAARAEGKEPPAGWPPLYFPANLERSFVDELCQEHYRKNSETGLWGWERPKSANDFGDALKYCLVGWYLLRPIIAMERAAENQSLLRAV